MNYLLPEGVNISNELFPLTSRSEELPTTTTNMSVTIFLLFAGVVLGLENVERYQPVEITRSGDARLGISKVILNLTSLGLSVIL